MAKPVEVAKPVEAAEASEALPVVEPAAPSADLWEILGATIRGTSHVGTDLPNQDAIAWRPESRKGQAVLLAVADGHGSPKSFRSDTGSRLAVETALEIFQEFLDSQADPLDMSACNCAVDEQLPVMIERRWKEAVTRHLEEYPLLVREVQRVEESQARQLSRRWRKTRSMPTARRSWGSSCTSPSSPAFRSATGTSSR